jgi:hypothetical protein
LAEVLKLGWRIMLGTVVRQHLRTSKFAVAVVEKKKSKRQRKKKSKTQRCESLSEETSSTRCTLFSRARVSSRLRRRLKEIEDSQAEEILGFPLYQEHEKRIQCKWETYGHEHND